MNYRHAYHAGNFADVLKHLLLSLVIVHLRRKDTPFRVIDTHAGAGLYDLDSVEARKTGEWREGIGRLLDADIPQEIADILQPYLDVVSKFGCEPGSTLRTTGHGGIEADGVLTRYPGSPIIAAELLRPSDALIANELHPEDRNSLERALAQYRHAKVTGLDGYVALKSNLPPKERRGVVLIDPPFEEPGELQRLVGGLRQGVKRFATGTYMLWYPIKDPTTTSAFKQDVAGLGLEKLVAVEFFIRRPVDIEKLNGHGLIVLNPPFTLRADLEKVLPFLGGLLGQGEGASFAVEAL